MESFAKRFKVSETLSRKGGSNEDPIRVNTLPRVIFEGRSFPVLKWYLRRNEDVQKEMRKSDAFVRKKRKANCTQIIDGERPV